MVLYVHVVLLNYKSKELLITYLTIRFSFTFQSIYRQQPNSIVMSIIRTCLPVLISPVYM